MINSLKPLLCSLVSAFLFLAAPIQANVEVKSPLVLRDKWAVVVGISHFQKKQIDLRYAAKDAQDFAQYLVKEGQFAEDHVHVLLDEKATRESILSEIGDRFLPRVALPGDLVVIYFATHGSPAKSDIKGKNYLIAHNTDIEELYATGVDMQDLAQKIKDRVHCDRVVIILDACHSGSAEVSHDRSMGGARQINFDAESIAQGTGQLVICSSAPDQKSWESQHHQNGVFTYWLIEGLKSKGAKTRLAEAFDFTKERVEEEVMASESQLQSPMLRSKWHGDDLVLAAPATRPRKALIDTSEQELKPYLEKLQVSLKDNWDPPAELGQKTITVRFLVHSDGALTNVTIVKSSGNKEWDQKAVAAVFAASPAKPLPEGAPTRVGMQCTFDCHVTKSGSVCKSNPKLGPSVAVLNMVLQENPEDKDKTSLESTSQQLTQSLFDTLKEKFKEKVIEPAKAAELLKGKNVQLAAPDEGAEEHWKKVAEATGSRFILASVLEEIPVQGEKKKSLLTLSLKLIAGDTGETLWQMNGNSPKPWAGQQATGIVTYMTEIMLPDITTYLSEQLPRP